MWKLTIIQERLSEGLSYTIKDRVEFVAETIEELAQMVVSISRYAGAIQTSYRIEKVGEEDE